MENQKRSSPVNLAYASKGKAVLSRAVATSSNLTHAQRVLAGRKKKKRLARSHRFLFSS